MGIYRFLLLGIWKFHLTILITTCVVGVALGWRTNSWVQTVDLFETALLCYAFWIVGMITAVNSELHLYVKGK